MGAGCDKGKGGGVWFTEDLPYEQAKDEKVDHIRFAHHPLAVEPQPAQLKAKKLSRPSLRVMGSQVEEEAYEFFIHQWEMYKAQANLVTNSKQHLKSCIGDKIMAILYGRLGKEGWGALTEKDLLHHVKEVFVNKRNMMINRIKL